jgi:hypothetical protein
LNKDCFYAIKAANFLLSLTFTLFLAGCKKESTPVPPAQSDQSTVDSAAAIKHRWAGVLTWNPDTLERINNSMKAISGFKRVNMIGFLDTKVKG